MPSYQRWRCISASKARIDLARTFEMSIDSLGEKVPAWLDVLDFELHEGGEGPTNLDYLEIRRALFEIFLEIWPAGVQTQGTDSAKKRFDDEVTARIRSLIGMPPSLAADNRVWSYLTLRVLPDLARWRFENPTEERYLGNLQRNTFQHLWWREFMIGAERARQLSENDMVQILERPKTIGSRRLVVETLADRVIVLKQTLSEAGIGSDTLVKESSKRLLRALSVTSLDLMPSGRAQDFIEETIDDALRSLLQTKNEKMS